MSKLTEFKYWHITRPIERLQIKMADILPRWLVKWAVIRAMNHATSGEWCNEIVPEVTAMDVLDRWVKS